MGLTATELSLPVTAPHVLVADDEPGLVRGLRIMLRGAGYAVKTARSAADVLTLVDERSPDVLVERNPSRPEYLRTEPGIGYRLCEPGGVLT